MKRLLLIVLLLACLPLLGQAQKSGKGKAGGKPPVEQPPSVFPNSQLPAEIVIREGNRIFTVHVTAAGVPSWTYYDHTFNSFGGIHFEVGNFDSFQAVRMGGVVAIVFNARRPGDPGLLHPPIALTGSVDLDFAQGFFTIFTTGKGIVSFDILDNSRPSTMAASQNVCITTQFVPMRCAIGVPPGFESPIATH